MPLTNEVRVEARQRHEREHLAVARIDRDRAPGAACERLDRACWMPRVDREEHVAALLRRPAVDLAQQRFETSASYSW
jgi:hypothetical protein